MENDRELLRQIIKNYRMIAYTQKKKILIT